MQYDEFIRRVQVEGELDDGEAAEQAAEAVLATLGECIYRTEEAHLAAQLPRGIAQFLNARQSPEMTRNDTDRLSLEQFYNRVAARTNSRYPHAVKLSRAVAEVLMDAVSVGEIADIKRELPQEFGELFNRDI
jgi:uncharacterized protein (DUF2267 family)